MPGKTMDESTLKKFLEAMQDVVVKNPYLKKRYDAAVKERASRKAISNAKKLGQPVPAPVVFPFLRDPGDPKTETFDFLLPLMQGTSFRKMITSLEDGAAAEKYLTGLRDYLQFLQKLQTPTREDHGLTKIMTPEDYEQLQKRSDTLLKQTTALLGQFTVKKNNRIIPKNGLQNEAEILDRLQKVLAKDAGLARKLSSTKEPTTFGAAVKKASGVQVTGKTDRKNVVGAAQSTRKVITVEDKNGKQKTGLFTAKVIVSVSTKNARAENIAIGQLGAKKGTRLDNRNSAMTTVAEMLGRGDLLAHSKEMHIDSEITPDNPTGAGTFMEAVQGTDIDRILPDDPFFGVNISDPNGDIYTERAKKDMMDLCIVDYLCANMDRHGGNMIYHYSKDSNGVTRLDGLTGIDNDTAFTNKIFSVHAPANRLGALTETICISEEMAAKLEAMTEESLLRDMAPYGFRDDELAAMQQRMRNLKDALAEGKKFEADHLKDEAQWGDFLQNGLSYIKKHNGEYTTRKPCLVTISNEKLAKLRVDSLGNTHLNKDLNKIPINSGVFNVVCDSHSEAAREDNERTARRNYAKSLRKLQSNTILKEGVANFRDIAEASQKDVGQFIAQCAKKTSKIRGTSEEFEKVVETLRTIEETTRTLSQGGHIPNVMERNLLSELNSRLQENCTKYLQRKQKEQQESSKSFSTYAKDRIALVKEIGRYAVAQKGSIRMAWNQELEDEQIKMARASNVVAKFSGQMRPLTDYLNAKRASVGTKDKVDLTTIENNFIEKLDDLCRKLKNFSDTAPDLPGVKETVHDCAEQMDLELQYLQNKRKVEIPPNIRTMVNSCKAPKKPENLPVTNDKMMEAASQNVVL